MCPASEGWTTDMFVEAIYNGVRNEIRLRRWIRFGYGETAFA